MDFNFGSIELNLGEDPNEDNLKLQVRNFDGKVVLERTIFFSELEQRYLKFHIIQQIKGRKKNQEMNFGPQLFLKKSDS
jgi:hypothetical protein